MPRSSRSFLGEFEQRVLLAILRCGDRPRPVDIRRELVRVSNQEISRGAFYTTLDRLKAKKLIDWTTVAGDEARGGLPDRRCRVTAAGVRALKRPARLSCNSGADWNGSSNNEPAATFCRGLLRRRLPWRRDGPHDPGDLREEHLARVERGRGARAWYWGEALSLALRYRLRRHTDTKHKRGRWNVSSDVKIALRTLARSPGMCSHGLITYTVGQRVAEFGTRFALGARPSHVLKLVFGQVARLIAIGLGVGVLAGLAVGQGMRSVLYGVSAADPVTIGGVVVLISAIALAASVRPALSAARINLVDALKSD